MWRNAKARKSGGAENTQWCNNRKKLLQISRGDETIRSKNIGEYIIHGNQTLKTFFQRSVLYITFSLYAIPLSHLMLFYTGL